MPLQASLMPMIPLLRTTKLPLCTAGIPNKCNTSTEEHATNRLSDWIIHCSGVSGSFTAQKMNRMGIAICRANLQPPIKARMAKE